MSTTPQDLMDALMRPKRTSATISAAVAQQTATLDAVRAYARTLYAEGSATLHDPNTLTIAQTRASLKRSIASDLLSILRNAGAAPTKSTPST